MKLSIIVAVSRNGIIGKEGALPWRLPAELARFKQITKGHPVIMGRKTHESIGRALPDRQNIIISRDKKYQAEGCIRVGSLEEALAKAEPNDEVFIIGGASIYELALPITDRIYLTRVMAEVEGDRRFEFNESEWKLIDSEEHSADAKNNYDFVLQQWVRK